MKKYKVTAHTGNTDIYIGEQLANLDKYIKTDRAIIITDKNVNRLYGSRFPDYPKIVLGMGEKVKTLKTMKKVYNRFLELDADRHSTTIIGIGGGVVCDIAGFAASTYMRGIKHFGHVASTLLCQVDASLGGKNGVNLNSYKNMIGVFNQPNFIIDDITMFDTLEDQEYISGLGELVKSVLLTGPKPFKFLEDNVDAILEKDFKVMETAIYNAVKTKGSLVSKDEFEYGVRKQMNLGHTVGHAIEKLTGIRHGEGVAIGIAFAAEASVIKGYMKPQDKERIINLLINLRLPTDCDVSNEKIAQALLKDKKRDGDSIYFVYLDGIGKSRIEKTKINELVKLLYDLR